MKMLTMIAAASVAALAFAEEPAAKPEGKEATKAPSAERGPMRRGDRPEGRPHNPGMMMGQDVLMRALRNPRLAKMLNLTDEQKAKLGDGAERRKLNRELQEKARKATERQIELLQAETIDEAAVMAAIDEAFEARKAMAKEQTKRVILVRSVLTPEQVKIATEALKEMRGPGRRPETLGDRPGKRDGKKGTPKGAPEAAK